MAYEIKVTDKGLVLEGDASEFLKEANGNTFQKEKLERKVTDAIVAHFSDNGKDIDGTNLSAFDYAIDEQLSLIALAQTQTINNSLSKIGNAALASIRKDSRYNVSEPLPPALTRVNASEDLKSIEYLVKAGGRYSGTVTTAGGLGNLVAIDKNFSTYLNSKYRTLVTSEAYKGATEVDKVKFIKEVIQSDMRYDPAVTDRVKSLKEASVSSKSGGLHEKIELAGILGALGYDVKVVVSGYSTDVDDIKLQSAYDKYQVDIAPIKLNAEAKTQLFSEIQTFLDPAKRQTMSTLEIEHMKRGIQAFYGWDYDVQTMLAGRAGAATNNAEADMREIQYRISIENQKDILDKTALLGAVSKLKKDPDSVPVEDRTKIMLSIEAHYPGEYPRKIVARASDAAQQNMLNDLIEDIAADVVVPAPQVSGPAYPAQAVSQGLGAVAATSASLPSPPSINEPAQNTPTSGMEVDSDMAARMAMEGAKAQADAQAALAEKNKADNTPLKIVPVAIADIDKTQLWIKIEDFKDNDRRSKMDTPAKSALASEIVALYGPDYDVTTLLDGDFKDAEAQALTQIQARLIKESEDRDPGLVDRAAMIQQLGRLTYKGDNGAGKTLSALERTEVMVGVQTLLGETDFPRELFDKNITEADQEKLVAAIQKIGDMPPAAPEIDPLEPAPPSKSELPKPTAPVPPKQEDAQSKPTTPAPTAPAAPRPYDAKVGEAQSYLYALGHLGQPETDGIRGGRTNAAIAAYKGISPEDAAKLSLDEIVPALKDEVALKKGTPAVQEKIKAIMSQPAAQIDKEEGRTVQNFLNATGYTDAENKALEVDGIVGPKTRAAYQKYEAAISAGFNQSADPGKPVAPVTATPATAPPVAAVTASGLGAAITASGSEEEAVLYAKAEAALNSAQGIDKTKGMLAVIDPDGLFDLNGKNGVLVMVKEVGGKVVVNRVEPGSNVSNIPLHPALEAKIKQDAELLVSKSEGMKLGQPVTVSVEGIEFTAKVNMVYGKDALVPKINYDTEIIRGIPNNGIKPEDERRMTGPETITPKADQPGFGN